MSAACRPQAAFQLFGDRVKYFTTINEPFTVCVGGYGVGTWAPGRCSDRKQCKQGNSVTEPPRCAYHVLLAHAAAVPHFRRLVPDGQISIVNAVYPFHMPLTGSKQDVVSGWRPLASERDSDSTMCLLRCTGAHSGNARMGHCRPWGEGSLGGESMGVFKAQLAVRLREGLFSATPPWRDLAGTLL